MPRLLRRETFIALRARRQAHQIAREIINPPLDLTSTFCRFCGKSLNTDRLDPNDQIPCHSCGQINILPHELAERIRAVVPILPPAHREFVWTELTPTRHSTRIKRLAALLLLIMMLAGLTAMMLAAAMELNHRGTMIPHPGCSIELMLHIILPPDSRFSPEGSKVTIITPGAADRTSAIITGNRI